MQNAQKNRFSIIIMKGKHYTPLYNENVVEGLDFYDSTFKFPMSPKAIKKYRVNTRESSPVTYI